jgi:O-6-methylguanine DNA methyltransferase
MTAVEDYPRTRRLHVATQRLRVATPLGLDLVIGVADGHIVSSHFERRHQKGCSPPARCSKIVIPSLSREAPQSARERSRRIASDAGVLRDAKRQVTQYFKGRLARFALPLEVEGTPFEREVWTCVAQLGFGEFASYADIARAVGRPLSHRAVARAMGRTPLDLLIPAHRVVGADGKPRGTTPRSLRSRLIAFERNDGGYEGPPQRKDDDA